MDLRAPERLVGIDVADPNDAALVKKQALDTCRPMPNQRAKGANGKRRSERLNAMVGEERRRMRVEARGSLTVSPLCNERNTPKGTYVSEAKLTTIV
jgi:hypothetical protein